MKKNGAYDRRRAERTAGWFPGGEAPVRGPAAGFGFPAYLLLLLAAAAAVFGSGAAVGAQDTLMGPDVDRAALEALYHATGGEQWANNENWLDDAQPLDRWYGVATNAPPSVVHAAGSALQLELRRVTELDLDGCYPYECRDPSGNGMFGSIPSDVGELADLQELSLNGNALTGPLPPRLQRLTNLKTLDLGRNRFYGERLPAWLGNLTDLEELILETSGWTGPIPASLGDLTNLEELDLSLNEFEGELPAELGNLDNLRSLELFVAYGDGGEPDGEPRSLPESWRNLTSLESLWLGGNRLGGGPFPAWLGELTRLRKLDVYRSGTWTGDGWTAHKDGWTGPLPTELTHLTNLEFLRLSGHPFDGGSLPDWLGGMTSLLHLDISANGWTGRLPASLANLTNLEELRISNNRLSGPLPSWLGDLTNLTSLSLGGNDWTGGLQASLAKLTNLRDLDVSHIQNGGRMPSWFGEMTNLERLRAVGNGWTGPLPASLGDLTNLRDLNVSRNPFDGGPLPAVLGTLPFLEDLELRNNGWSGPLPAWLRNLNLRWLDLDSNALTGTVPAWFGDLTDLQVLDLSHNPGLTGPLPQSLTKLKVLLYLDFSYTGLCAPANADFQRWLSLLEWWGEVCAAGGSE